MPGTSVSQSDTYRGIVASWRISRERERETDFGVADPFRESAVRGARVGEAGLAADLKAYRGTRR